NQQRLSGVSSPIVYINPPTLCAVIIQLQANASIRSEGCARSSDDAADIQCTSSLAVGSIDADSDSVPVEYHLGPVAEIRVIKTKRAIVARVVCSINLAVSGKTPARR